MLITWLRVSLCLIYTYMNYRKIELHISQTDRLVSKSRKTFPEPEKQAIYNRIIELFEKVKASDYKNFSDAEIIETQRALYVVFNDVY